MAQISILAFGPALSQFLRSVQQTLAGRGPVAVVRSRDLDGLSDHLLRDIGLTRVSGRVHRAAREGGMGGTEGGMAKRWTELPNPMNANEAAPTPPEASAVWRSAA